MPKVTPASVCPVGGSCYPLSEVAAAAYHARIGAWPMEGQTGAGGYRPYAGEKTVWLSLGRRKLLVIVVAE